MAGRFSSSPYGTQQSISLDPVAIEKLASTREWTDWVLGQAEKVAQLCRVDYYPVGDTPYNRGQQPRGLYRESYEASTEIYKGKVNGVVSNDEREAIWIEQGFHPGGSSTFVPGRHVMDRALMTVMRGTTASLQTAASGSVSGRVLQAQRKLEQVAKRISARRRRRG
jgi:hypothetical protein